MIRHIVMFKLTDYKNEEDKQAKINQMKAVFGGLKHKIKEITSYIVAENINASGDAYDVIIDSGFNTIEDLNIYICHPMHQHAIRLNKSIAKIKAVVDYEV